MAKFHESVLLTEAVKFLKVREGEKYIDATVGGGGHAEAILNKKGKLLGIDCDPEALEFSRKRLVSACPPSAFCWKLTKGNFALLKEIAQKHGFSQVAGIFFDLGSSFYQLKESKRGFSFADDLSLDMRMDPEIPLTARNLVNGLSQRELRKLFLTFGEEYSAGRIAQAIVSYRSVTPIKTGSQLAELIERVVPQPRRRLSIHPATRSFQALRIAVNNELENIERALPQAVDLLKSGGRLVVISFHSLEDRIVKDFFKKEKDKKILKVLTKRPMRPSAREKEKNPRSRSAKLRAAEKLI